MPLKQQMVMPRAVESRHAEGGRADPEEAAVGNDVHGGGGVPGVSDAEHVVEEAHDEDAGEARRVGVREVVEGDEEARPVADEVEILLGHVELGVAGLAQAAEEIDDEDGGEGGGVGVGRGHDDEDDEGVGEGAVKPED